MENKKTFLVIIFTLLSVLIFAQQQDEDESKYFDDNLDTDKHVEISGGFVAPEIKFGNLNGAFSTFIGGKIGLIHKEKTTFGAAIYYLTTENEFINQYSLDPDLNEKLSIEFIYGGYYMDFIIYRNKRIHITVPIILGAARTNLFYMPKGSYQTWESLENTTSFIFDTGFSIEIIVSKYLRVNIGPSYRYVIGTKLNNLSDKDLSDISYNCTFKLGVFN